MRGFNPEGWKTRSDTITGPVQFSSRQLPAPSPLLLTTDHWQLATGFTGSLSLVVRIVRALHQPRRQTFTTRFGVVSALGSPSF